MDSDWPASMPVGGPGARRWAVTQPAVTQPAVTQPAGAAAGEGKSVTRRRGAAGAHEDERDVIGERDR